MLKKLLSWANTNFFVQSNASLRSASSFYDIGFHGDKYLLDLVRQLAKEATVFIETGTNVGSTLAYVAQTYPDLACFSCEPDLSAFGRAVENTRSLNNVNLFNESSREFLDRVQKQYNYLTNSKAIFWLDAHGHGFEWPLREEIRLITYNFRGAYILIDDFKVPGRACFGYDQYHGQECSFEFIKPALNQSQTYRLYYPSYSEKTSKHHRLRGWGLLAFGRLNDLELPNWLKDKIVRAL